MSAPSVPQRPARSLHREQAHEAPTETPKVPPRPQRVSASSQSREREASARSPLNDTGFAANGMAHTTPANNISEEELRRPPSVPSLPIVGQEGIEYASLSHPQVAALQKAESAAAPKSPQETRNVSSDLPLHAPKASASPMTQKTRVAAVTRTDSEKAAHVGVGKAQTEYAAPNQPDSQGDYRPPSAVSTERPESSQAQSMYETEEGIPSFGTTIPLYPNAGDVQAPTPATPIPGSAGLTPVDLSRPGTTDGRRRSAHGFHGPPGSYGLHGHGQLQHDKFEKAWYEKHPEELAKEEESIHHPAAHDERPSWAMSSDDLNKLVHDTGRSSSGFGTNPEMIGTPTEAIGYQASLEYTARSQTPQTPQHHPNKQRASRPGSSSYMESPLKKTFSAQEYSESSETFHKDTEDENIHLIPPTRPQGKYSGAGYDPPTENLGPTGGNTDERGGWIDEQGEGVPILASDEIAKYPSTEWMQPAVSPAQQMTEDDYYSAADSDVQPSYRSSHQRSRSKGHSRPGSGHSYSGLSRFSTHEEGLRTPLEEIEEYEPLFREDEKEDAKQAKGFASKRPQTLKQQHFPSQDIWEDTPDSLRLEATVATPEPTGPSTTSAAKPSTLFEHPDVEQQRKAEFTEAERESALRDPSKGFVKPKFRPAVHEEVQHRPGLSQRFPSRDIWEDTPDSLRLETTVGSNEAINVSVKSPVSASKPTVPARPVRSKAEAVSEAPSLAANPSMKEQTMTPDPSRPVVPQRPTRSLNKETSDPSSLTKTVSAESATSPDDVTVAKAKPAVPARPSNSSKFASIKAGFMNDLNSRLSKGAPPPKPQQEEAPKEVEEKARLGDARKSRARGPARRKPAVSPTPHGDTESSSDGLRMATPRPVWRIDPGEETSVHVHVGLGKTVSQSTKPTTAMQLGEMPSGSPLATNTAGEPLQSKVETPSISSGHLAHPSSDVMDARAHRESAAAKERLRELDRERIGHEGDVPDPIVDQPTGETPEIKDGEGAPLSPQKTETKEKVMEMPTAHGEVAHDTAHAADVDPAVEAKVADE